ncbi:MAG: alpha/beta fold hydrolase [Candidatus Sulfotelmatobacter sp.]
MPHTFCKLLLCAGSCILALSPASATDSWHVTGTPAAITQDFPFTNGKVNLAGTLYLPATGDHLPAVVALHAALVANRDAELYRHLREGLPAIGIAVLLYDRRGSGGSSGNYDSSDYETLASDAVAGQHALAAISRIDPRKIGFWGLSQGGWLALLAASSSPDAAFAVVVSAPLVTPEKQMQFATANLLTVRGYSQSDVERMLTARKAWIDYIRGGQSRAGAASALRDVETQPWFELAFLPKASQLPTDPGSSPWHKKVAQKNGR